MHRGDRECVVVERLSDRHIRPAQHLPITHDEWLKAIAALAWLDAPGLGHQGLGIVLGHPDHSPRRELLEILRVRTNSLRHSTVRKECVRIRKPLDRRKCDRVQNGRAALNIDPNLLCLSLREKEHLRPVPMNTLIRDTREPPPVD